MPAGYKKLRTSELAKLCRDRGLSDRGGKKILMKRLKANDARESSLRAIRKQAFVKVQAAKKLLEEDLAKPADIDVTEPEKEEEAIAAYDIRISGIELEWERAIAEFRVVKEECDTYTYNFVAPTTYKKLTIEQEDTGPNEAMEAFLAEIDQQEHGEIGLRPFKPFSIPKKVTLARFSSVGGNRL